MSIPLHLDLDPERERSVSLEADLRDTGRLPRPSSTGEERAADFLNWTDSFADLPVLSDEAISRANLNPDRW